MLFGKKASQPSAQDLKWLDEIHVRPEVKKVFILFEIFTTINSLLAMVILVSVLSGVNSMSIANLNIITLVSLAQTNPLLLAVILIAVGGYFVIRMLSKKYTAELQKLEEAGIREIKQAIEEGTYVPGPTVGLGYRIFRTARTVILVGLMAYLLFILVKMVL